MLDLRMHILDSVVDYFVVVNSVESIGSYKTHVADSSPAPFRHKTLWLTLPKLEPPLTANSSTWDEKKYSSDRMQREKYQRDRMLHAALAVSKSEDDFLLCSDVDEIPDPRIINKIEKIQPLFRVPLDFYYYNVNCSAGIWYEGTTVGRLHQYKTLGGVGNIRWSRMVPCWGHSAGWHFSYFGGFDRIRNKVQNFSHAGDDICINMLKRSDTENREIIRKGLDLFGRTDQKLERHSSDDPSLPEYFLKHKDRYPHFFDPEIDKELRNAVSSV